MLRYKRNLLLDVFDYEGHKLCSLYDNAIESSGQASNVIVTTQRNGWKTLSFDIPSTCNSEDGEIPNFRLQYLKADYKIRLVDDEGTDWFFVSEPKITHANYSKNVSVTAGHISQLLKTKNLGLEFNDQLGNNVGTAYELLTTILEGTTWKPGVVYNFLEKGSNNPKRRSLRAAAKTGAFKLITQMCELFDAKPVFHGHTRTVDIIPMNPFSIPRGGNLPSIFTGKEENTQQSRAIELHYGQNVSNVTRTLNTDNIVTKLYAYGSWGDTATGYCGIDECKHKEYTLYGTMPPEGQPQVDNPSECTNFRNWQELKFTVIEDDGIPNVYYFRIKRIYGDTAKDVADELSDLGLYVDSDGYVSQANASSYDTTPIPPYLVWSDLDPASRMYVWDTNRAVAYKTYREAETDNPFDLGVYGSGNDQKKTFELIENEFSYLMDYDYYNSVDLLTDEMVQKIAEFQRTAPDFMRMIEKASEIYNKDLEDLSGLVGGVINYCRLPSVPFSFGESDPQYVTVTFDNPTFDNLMTYQVIQETIRKRKWLKDDDQEVDWYHDMIHVATGIRPNGDPVNTNASVMYIVHSDGVWHKTYLKEMYLSTDGKKTTIVTWLPKSAFPTKPDTLADDYANSTLNRYYLFEVNNVNGHIGGLEVGIESITEATKTAEDDGTTILHKLFAEEHAPSTDSCIGPGFWGWWWKYRTDGNPSKLYFCWGDTTRWAGGTHDRGWYPVYIGDIYVGETTPKNVSEDDAYWYCSRTNEYGTDAVRGKLWRKHNKGAWVRIGEIATDDPEYNPDMSAAEKLQRKTDQSVLVNHFSSIISNCYSIEQILKGQYSRYRWVVPSSGLTKGNYAFETDFNKYWLFTVQQDIPGNEGYVLSYDTSGSDLLSVRKPVTYYNQKIEDLQKLLDEQHKQAYQQDDVEELENQIALMQSADDPDSQVCKSITLEVTDYTLMTMLRDQDAVGYHPRNIMTLASFEDGKFCLTDEDGNVITSPTSQWGAVKPNSRDFKRTSYIPVPVRSKYHKEYTFATTETDPNITNQFTVYYYDADKKFIKYQQFGEDGAKSATLNIPKNTAYIRMKRIGLNMDQVYITEILKPKKVQIPGTKQTYNEDRDPVIIFNPDKTAVTVKDGDINSKGKNLKAVLYVTSNEITVGSGVTFEFVPRQAPEMYKLFVFEETATQSGTTKWTRLFDPNDGLKPGHPYTFTTSSVSAGSVGLRIVALKGFEDKPIIRLQTNVNTIVARSASGQDVTYTILPKPEGEGILKGLVPMIEDFADDSDRVYFSDRPYLTALQDQLKAMETDLAETLGDIFREGYWQKNDYVDGDERKLYDDAFENIEHVSKPEASYSVNYLDLYGANEDNLDYGVTPATAKINWPDIKLTDAIHLVDPEIGVNCWAYIDELKKCYDQPWRTTITINTNLTLMNQHSFTDVISYIADVANQARGHETMYERAKQFTRNGRIMAQLLEDTISTERNLITSVQSSWYTDEKGAQMFEATDGTSAMRLTGAGFAIANSKDDDGDWRWRTFGTGNGFTADLITAGHIRATLIEAGTISAEMLTNDLNSTIIQLGEDVQGLNTDVSNLTTHVGETDGKLQSVFIFGQNDLIIQQGTTDGTTWNYNHNASVFGAKKLEFYAGTYTSGPYTYPKRMLGIYSDNTTLINTGQQIGKGLHFFGSNQGVPDVSLTDTGLKITKGEISLGTGSFVVDTNGKVTIKKGSITIKDGNTENFKVTEEGILTARSADIKGTIRADELYIGDKKAVLSLDSNGALTFSSVGGLSDKFNDYVTFNALPGEISANVWDELGNQTGFSIKKTGINVTSTGKLLIDTTNFKLNTSGDVTVSGNITATSGAIGPWSVDADSLFYSGTDAYIALQPGQQNQIYIKVNNAYEIQPLVISNSSGKNIGIVDMVIDSSRSGTRINFKLAPWAEGIDATSYITLSAGQPGVSPITLNKDTDVVGTLKTSGIFAGYASGSTGANTSYIFDSLPEGRYLLFTMKSTNANLCTSWIISTVSGGRYATKISEGASSSSAVTVTVGDSSTVQQRAAITVSATTGVWMYLLRIA